VLNKKGVDMLKDSEAALRRLAVILKDSNDAITVLDLYGNYIAWNKGAEKTYGYTEEEALKMNIVEVIPEGLEKDALNFINHIASGQILQSYETQRVSKRGKIFDVLITATCLKDNSGKIDSIAMTEQDITALKNELRAKEKEVKILRGFLPICASCKKIRDVKGYWHQVEAYIRDHSEVEFTHSICPKCMNKLYPEFREHKDNK
jgi:PAS domain S-box-containing protein